MAQRYCTNCDAELREQDRFCPSCGRPVHETAAVSTPEADVFVPPAPHAAEDTSGHPARAEDEHRPRISLGKFLIGGFVLLGGLWLLIPTEGGSGGGGGGGESAGSNDPPIAEEAADETKELPTKKKQANNKQPPVDKQAAQDPEPKPEPNGKKNDSSGQAPPANVPPPTVDEQLFAKIAGVFLLKKKSVDSMAKYVRGQEFKPSQADGLKRVYIVRDARGCGYINVEFYEQDASFMEFSMEQVYESVYKNRELSQNVCNVQVSAFQELQDDYGQTFMTKTYVTSMNKATASKVRDWLMVEQPKIWTVHKMHPVVKEELAQNAVEHAADCAKDEGLFDMQPLDCP